MFTNYLHRTSDDDALRMKVDEAMNVYDEYLKNQGGPLDGDSAATTNGTENINPSNEDGKDAE